MNEEQPQRDPLNILVDMLELLWQKRWTIIRNTMIPTLLSVVVCLFLTKYYVATTTVLPDLDYLNSLKGRLAGLQDLASDLGISGGNGISPSQLYPEIILSETILHKVIYHPYTTEKYPRPVNLLEYFDYDTTTSALNYEVLLRSLRDNIVSVTVDRKSTVITVSTMMPEPQLAADVANQITKELDTYQRGFRNTRAGAQRQFLETRLQDVRMDLQAAEDALKDFREKNRMISQAPQLVLDQARLERIVTINNSIYIELRKQYEIVKLDEVKNTPVVSVLDIARAPVQKEKPRRIMIVLTVFMIAFISSTAGIIFQSKMKEMEAESEGVERLVRFIRSIFSRSRTL